MTKLSPPAVPRLGTTRPERVAGRSSARIRVLRREAVAWGFVGPFMVVFALTLVVPIGYSAYLSLFREQLIGGVTFVGLDNYLTLVADPKFHEALGRVLLFVALQVPIMMTIALGAALALDGRRVLGGAFYRISVFLPYAVPAVVATLMWGFMYGTRFGLVANLNDVLGFELPDPLSSNLVLLSIGNIVTWEYVGYNMLIFYSALKAIPHELYEAAQLDGARPLQIVARIKLPAIRPAMLVAAIFSVIGSFQLFNEPNILQAAAPNAISTYFTPNMYAYNLSFAGQQFNYAATVAIVMGLVTMVVAYLIQRTSAEKRSQP